MGRAGEYTIADSCQKRRDERLEEPVIQDGGRRNETGDGGASEAELGGRFPSRSWQGWRTCVSGERGCG